MSVKVVQRSKRGKWRLKVNATIFGTSKRPRLSVFRSSKNIYSQIVDDSKGSTLLALSTKDIKDGTKTEKAKTLGKNLSEKLLKMGIEAIVFDRGGYHYHGRVKAVAEGAREGGLKF